MSTLKERLERIEVEEPVHIPTLDGTGIAETIQVKVPAWRDPKDGEIYLDTEATDILDKVKARHMGLLTPDQIKALRERLGLTQKQLSEMLQIGEKTWTRWETGRDRPSRSINVLLCALNDGKIDTAYLRSLAQRRHNWANRISELPAPARNPWLGTAQELWQQGTLEADHLLAQDLQRAVADVFRARGLQSDFGFQIQAKVTVFARQPANVIRVQPAKPTAPSARSIKPPELAPSRAQILADAIAA